MQWVHPFPYYMFLVGLLSLGLSMPLIRPPRTYGRMYLTVLLMLAGILMILVALELFATEKWAMLLLRNLQQVPLFFAPIMLFGLAREYAGFDSSKTVAWLALLALPCLFFTGLIFSDEFHGLFRLETGIETIWGLTQVQVEQTLLGFALTVYPVGIAVISIGLLLQNLFGESDMYRTQHLYLLIPYLVSLVNIIMIPLLPHTLPGQMAFGFSITAILLFILYYRYNLLTIWPVAKDRIFDAMKEAVLIFDREFRLVEMNHAASDWIGRWSGSNTEKGTEGGLMNWFEQDKVFYNAMKQRMRANAEREMMFAGEHDKKYMEIRSFPIARSRSGDEATLVIMSDITAQKRYEADLIRQATEDYLTGIPNRRHFIELFKNRPQQNEESLLLIDLDHFKQINDTYDHQTGDAVLQHFAGLLKAFFQEGFCGRIGGEEFGVFVPADSQTAVDQARQFQHDLNENPYITDDQTRIHMPVSIGVAAILPEAPDFETVYRQADEAMYLAKEKGRNQVVCYQEHFNSQD